MEPGPWAVGEHTAILHGGFLLAARLIQPRALRELRKADWPLAGVPITDALREIGERCPSPQEHGRWKREAVAIVWAKVLLPAPPAASLEWGWRDDGFFSVGAMIPDVNHTALFELVKALGVPRVFVELLLALPPAVCREQLEHMVAYVTSETSPSDIRLFLDVWWEVMKHKEGQEDATVSAFSALMCQHGGESSLDDGLQPPKRFKGDPVNIPPAAPGLFMVLVEGLKQIHGNITQPRMQCYALANLAELLSVFTELEPAGSSLPTTEYLHKVSATVSLWTSDPDSQFHHSGLGEKVREAERTMSLLSVTKLSREELFVGLEFLCSLLRAWGEELQDALSSSEQLCYENYRLLDTLTTLGKNLVCFSETRDVGEDETRVVLELTQVTKDFLKESSASPKSKDLATTSLVSSVAMAIIAQKLDRHADMCSVFASEKTWAFSKAWVDCLVQNKALFQKPELVLKLLETLVSFATSCQDREAQELQVQVTKAIMDCYTELSLTDKNKVISDVLASWGGPGLSLNLQVVREGFQEDLNVTFNQITKSVSDEGLTRAVASVARLTLLYPEATVKQVCHLAVVNLGAHQFLAQILCSFPALRFLETQKDPGRPHNLVVRCLEEAVWEKLSTAREEEQFLQFLTFLMQPGSATPLVSPAEVTKAFVLPYLKSDSPQIELSLQVLSKALGIQPCSEEYWIKSCHPFPLLLSLCKLLDGYTRYWHQPREQLFPSLETKDLILNILCQLCEVVGPESAPSPELWIQSLAWLHRKVASLDWTVGLRLKKLYGDHFKNEVPATLFEICTLPEDEWTSQSLPAYGPGSGLLAWMECCCVSPALRDTMLALLTVNVDNPEEVNLFSKGFLVALIQVLPWCSHSEWRRLMHVVENLLQRQVLHVPYTLEYVQYMPLLNLRPFACYLQLSVLFLRGFQLLCSSSCSTWLPPEAWLHVVQLYCGSLTDLLTSVKGTAGPPSQPAGDGTSPQEVSFVCIQMFCHLLHVAAMLPGEGCGEPLVVVALEILSQYEAFSNADTSPSNTLRRANERHFLEAITDNVGDRELRSTLLQKLSKLGAHLAGEPD
ncbi:PREDICTED: gem-associated protein 4 [Lepidothrix coronata]|uniref:Gem-associated protein 4 n=1 Tax=Lepidothrix coronata TaxID=321398 RepID=A0A6J0HT77_9PASS|nr:PREDICTED: gem-associated protein 4 [Lepidothrix coronata]XP_017677150.1 PREDICTED: gem-associated protein 4 [Lepidothrix coronata]XP_017677151.1 PREDICTED: gem-associated protein 4 [Lepidothrix coronata]